MYPVSETWETIMGNNEHWFESKVVVDGVTYSQDKIMSMSTSFREFAEEHPSVGACLSAELKLTMVRPTVDIPRMASVEPYVRCKARARIGEGTLAGIAVTGESVVGVERSIVELTSEWIPQGKFFIDTREYTRNDDDLNLMTLHCYDSMLKTEGFYPNSTLVYPADSTDVVQLIATTIGVDVDDRTWELMQDYSYSISLPADYTMREVLSYIAAMFCGNFVMTYDGELLLVGLDSMPEETSYLVDNFGFAITFGGDRILV